MNKNPTLIAIVCGLSAAVLFLSQISLGGLGLLLSTFTTFPLFISVLGFGTRAGLISGGVAAAAVAAFFNPLAAVFILFFTLGPALWIGHIVGLSRDDNGVVEWFPVSAIVLRLSIISATITIISGAIAGYSTEFAQEFITNILNQFIKIQTEANNGTVLIKPEEIADRALLMAQIIPLVFPISIFFLMSINLLLGARFVRKRGWMLRPQDDLAATIAIPRIGVSILAIAIAASLLPEPMNLPAKAIAGAFGAAFIAVGLACIHYLSRNLPARSVMLALTYAAFLLVPIASPLIALFGIAETLFQLRARFAVNSSPSS